MEEAKEASRAAEEIAAESIRFLSIDPMQENRGHSSSAATTSSLDNRETMEWAMQLAKDSRDMIFTAMRNQTQHRGDNPFAMFSCLGNFWNDKVDQCEESN